MQHSELHKRLRPIQKRMHRFAVLRSAIHALLVGSALALLLAVLRLAGVPLLVWVASIIPLLVVSVGIALAFLEKPSWMNVAREVDQVYVLKDRALTAVCLTEKSDLVPLQQLQIDDALLHLQAVSANRVIPRVMPQVFPLPVCCCLPLGYCLPCPLHQARATRDQNPFAPNWYAWPKNLSWNWSTLYVSCLNLTERRMRTRKKPSGMRKSEKR